MAFKNLLKMTIDDLPLYCMPSNLLPVYPPTASPCIPFNLLPVYPPTFSQYPLQPSPYTIFFFLGGVG